MKEKINVTSVKLIIAIYALCFYVYIFLQVSQFG